MFPVSLDIARLSVLVVGDGMLAEKRLQLLRDAGATRIDHLSEPPEPEALSRYQILFIAGLSPERTAVLAEAARRMRVMVNAEDQREYCDFHVPAMLRRGDLLVAVSTGGASPTLARAIKDMIADDVGPEWEPRVRELAKLRARWQAEGASMRELGARSKAYILQQGWFVPEEAA